MARQGTLPEFLYQRHLEVGDTVHLNFGFHEDEDLNEDEACEEANDSDEGQNEFDESSDEDVDISTDPDNNSQGQQDELGTSFYFLFGARSRYGRAVRFNN